ncbi:uncharacterized protein PFL1_02669 [Pseudozyma flocculosa PF-1]|uniref:Uncharacterized protein n=2 Tax=Pseudozyma flocculosa TaxID=84751 RepID=A0A5C3F0A2_9BASI|nr:uncharacterized protein PFL1_02669 [Pseudozyma flocculosa PF-1]EPQ29996.1 hypothetical protein PFL1_02669 [Pseudozyma flocculosa PF-1]SPO37316.1 uncharacterized protein PSFLO_02789 [Pseudozyma flocculosa]
MPSFKVQYGLVALAFSLALSGRSMTASAASVPPSAGGSAAKSSVFDTDYFQNPKQTGSVWLSPPTDAAKAFAQSCIAATDAFLNHPETTNASFLEYRKEIKPCDEDDIKRLPSFYQHQGDYEVTGSKCALIKHLHLKGKDGRVAGKNPGDPQWQPQRPPGVSFYYQNSMFNTGKKGGKPDVSAFAAVARCFDVDTFNLLISPEEADVLGWQHPVPYQPAEPYSSEMFDVSTKDMTDAVARMATACSYTFCIASGQQFHAPAATSQKSVNDVSKVSDSTRAKKIQEALEAQQVLGAQ